MPFKFLKFRSIQRTLVLLFVFMLFLRLLSHLRKSEVTGVSRTPQSFHRTSDPVMERNIHTPEGQVSWPQTRFLGETQVSKCREAVLNRCHCLQPSRPRIRPQAAGLTGLFPVRLLQVAAHCQASLEAPRPARGRRHSEVFLCSLGKRSAPPPCSLRVLNVARRAA